MRTPTDFSRRKLQRKIDQVGYKKAIIASAELLSRQIVLSPIVSQLCDVGVFKLPSQKEFEEGTQRIMSVCNKDGGCDVSDEFTTPFVAEINSGYILTKTGLATTSNGHIINGHLFPPERGRRFIVAKIIWQLFFEDYSLTTALVRKNMGYLDAEEISGESIAPLIPRYTDNYYHWLAQTVPKIRYLRAFEAETGLSIKYLVPGHAPSWMKETLCLLDIHDSKLEYASESVYRVNKLILPSFPVMTKPDYQWIANDVLENISCTSRDVGVRNNVYISRANAPERQVVNEKEVMEVLDRYGFERHLLENNTVSKNVEIFNKADIIVGAHGAGLTDLIYCKDATVIELFGSKIKTTYRNLSNIMGVDYMSLKCEPKSTDIVVDTQELASLIEGVI